MPNWCRTTVRFTGEQENLDLLEKDINVITTENRFSIAQSINPQPDELSNVVVGYKDGAKYWWKDTEEPLAHEDIDMLFQTYGYYDWYQWRLANWGSKSGDIDTEKLRIDKNHIVFKYESAWNDLRELHKIIAEEYKLSSVVSWWEESGYHGSYKILNGKVFDENIGYDYYDGTDDIGEEE